MQLVNKSILNVTKALLAVIALVWVVPFQPSVATGAPFTVDHYQVYELSFAFPSPVPAVGLKDQFGTEDVAVIAATHFGLPVNKNGEGVNHPGLHYLWWVIEAENEHPIRDVVVFNQFGETQLQVRQPRYLLNPAHKNSGPVAGEIGEYNHYKCYDVAAPVPSLTVILQDQFRADTASVLQPLFLCNPAEKTDPNGNTFPPPHPSEHLVCYEILTGDGPPIGIGITDQFVQQAPNELIHIELLCVPSLKEEIVQTEGGSWGKIKSIYR